MGGMFDITSLLKDPEFLLSTVPKFKLGPIKEEEEIRETKEENEEQMNGRVEEKLTEEDRGERERERERGMMFTNFSMSEESILVLYRN